MNVFFKATGEKDKSEFLYKNEVQKWLDLIRGSGFENIYDSLKLGISKPVLPLCDTRLLDALSHTFWFLPSVSSCYAMKNLLTERQNTFFQDYEVIVCAGARNEGGAQPNLDTVLNGLTFPGLFLKLAEIFLAPSSVLRYFCPRILVLLALISQLGVADMSKTIFIKLTVKLASVAWNKGIRRTGE